MKNRIEKLEREFVATPQSQSDADDLAHLTPAEREFWLWGMTRDDSGKLVPLTDAELKRLEFLAVKMDTLAGTENKYMTPENREWADQIRAEAANEKQA